MEELVSQSLSAITACKTNEWQGTLCLPASAQLFKGHFPTRPIVPGVVLVEAVRQAATRALNHSLSINTIKQIKFKDLVLPDECVTLFLTIIDEGSNYRLTATLQSGEVLKAKIILTLTPEQ